MSKKIYILDTNCYLTDYEAIYKFGTSDIVIPLKVLEEVDKHKKRQDGVGLNARNFIRILDELRAKGNLNKGVRIDKGLGLVRAKSSDLSILPPDFDPGQADNSILACALNVKAENPSKKIIVVSLDINLRVRCDSLGLECESYTENKVIKRVNDIYTGQSQLLVDDQLIDRFYSGENIYLEEDERTKEFKPNEFIILVSSSNEKKTGIARFVAFNKPLVKMKEYVKGKEGTVFGLTPRNKEQQMAVNLLMDDNVPVVTMMGSAGTGKAQPLYSKILTENGWTTMGEIKVGDKVATRSGKFSEVSGIFPQGKKSIYRVYFTDGTFTDCCDEHLWSTKTCEERDKKLDWSIKSLNDIKNSLYTKNGKRNHLIPMTEPVQFPKKELFLEPYLMGLILGDGGISIVNRIIISTGDQEIVDYLDSISEKYSISFRKTGKYDIHIKNKKRTNKINSISEEIQRLGLFGKKSFEKEIPEDYLFSSIDDRLQLLRGLMDTDGFISKDGTSIVFYTSSRTLADNVQHLVFSLGGNANVVNKQTYYIYNEEKKKGKPSYAVHINLGNINPFSLKRKSERFKEKVKYFPRRYIDKVEYVGELEAQCIYINDDEHLYLTDNFIVTHNTLMAIAAALEYVINREDEKQKYEKIIVSRSVMPMGKDIGFLPGTMEEKMAPWVAPIQDNLDTLFSNKAFKNLDPLEHYKEKGIIQVEALTYIRGRSLNNAFIIIDECQNMNIHEIKTVLTRVGENTKIILTGDVEQIDNIYLNETTNGLTYAIEKLKESELTGHVSLTKGERSKVATLAAKLL